MRSIVFAIVFLFNLSPILAAGQVQFIDLDKYAPGTFFSILVDIDTGEAFYAPTEGAKFINGDNVPYEDIVDRYGGHGEIGKIHDLDVKARNIYAGGVLIGENGNHLLKVKSISINSYRGARDYLVHKPFVRYFGEIVSELIEADITFENKLIPYMGDIPLPCQSVFNPI